MVIEDILKAFEKAESLYSHWNLSYEDYVFVGANSLRLQGYDVRELDRGEKNIDTVILKEKLPWKTSEKFTSLIPPRCSKEFEEYLKFLGETGYTIDFHLGNENLMKDSIEYTLPNGKIVKIQTPIGEAKTHEWLLREIAPYRGEEGIKWVTFVKDIKKEAIKHQDEKVIEICESIEKKYKDKFQPLELD